jgi:hypothetical protein
MIGVVSDFGASRAKVMMPICTFIAACALQVIAYHGSRFPAFQAAQVGKHLLSHQ